MGSNERWTEKPRPVRCARSHTGVGIAAALGIALLFVGSAAAAPMTMIGPAPLSASTPLVHPDRSIPPAASHDVRKVASHVYPKADYVNLVDSINSTALVDLVMDNGSNKLVMFNAVHNASKLIEFVPGGSSTYGASIESAGGRFFLAWNNTSSGKQFWQEVTLSGRISAVTLPIGNSLFWTFAFGNATVLFATSGEFLVKIDPKTLSLVTNYSSSLPAHVLVDSVLPVDGRLYLAGSRTLPNGAFNAYFGFLNLRSGKVTTVSRTITTYPSDLYGFFVALIVSGSDFLVGGALDTLNTTGTTFSYESVGGYLYRYAPETSTFDNLSALLPHKTWGVWAFEPWGNAVALSLSGFNYSLPEGGIAGGLYKFSSGAPSLVNETSVFPSGYLANVYMVTSFSNGWFFSGGYASSGFSSEIVAVKI
jgi:hypothetical protein